MIETLGRAMDADLGFRPIEKWVLVCIASSHGMPDEPTEEMIARSELSHGQFWAALNDLDRRRFIRLDAGTDPATALILT